MALLGGRLSQQVDAFDRATEEMILGSEKRSRENGWSYVANLHREPSWQVAAAARTCEGPAPAQKTPSTEEARSMTVGSSAMFITRFLAMSIAVLLSVGSNNATASTVHDLVTYCSSSIDSSDYSYCIGVMAGPRTLPLPP